jgi:hypothetical protein
MMLRMQYPRGFGDRMVMPRFNKGYNVQELGVQWRVIKTFKDFGAYRRWVNRSIQFGDEVETISLFYNDNGSGCMEIFHASGLMAKAPFSSSIVMVETLKKWRSIAKGKPPVVQFSPNGHGGYAKASKNTWGAW